MDAQVTINLAPAYRVVDIGYLPSGSEYSHAWAVNDAGQVVGLSGASATSDFIWDATNGLRDLRVPASGPVGIGCGRRYNHGVKVAS
jgi:hypothetical protein